MSREGENAARVGLVQLMLVVCIVLAILLLVLLLLFFKTPSIEPHGVVKTTAQLREISAVEREKIFQEVGIYQQGDAYLMRGCADPLSIELTTVDLNGDAEPEVVMLVKDTPCFSGVLQSNTSVFVQRSNGTWRDAIGFLPGMGVRLQEESTRGYANLELLLPEGCYPVFRWTGESYYQTSEFSTGNQGERCLSRNGNNGK